MTDTAMRMPPEWYPQDWLWIGFPHLAEEWSGVIARAQEQIAERVGRLGTCSDIETNKLSLGVDDEVVRDRGHHAAGDRHGDDLAKMRVRRRAEGGFFLGVHFVRRRRHSEQIEIHAAGEGALACRGRGAERRGVKLGKDEGVA